ncbi:hypothetical protein MCEREM30_01580 [Paracoccaceae bacterium]|jgi:hypothetical protein
MRRSRKAGQVFALAMVMLLLISTAWVCLMGAAVVLLGQWLGTGLALLVVGGALSFMVGFILLVVSALRRRDPPPPSLAQRVLPSAIAQSAASVVAHPLILRAALLVIGVLFALAAALLPSPKPPDRDPRS